MHNKRHQRDIVDVSLENQKADREAKMTALQSVNAIDLPQFLRNNYGPFSRDAVTSQIFLNGK